MWDFLFFFEFSIFLLVRFCSFHFPQIPIMPIEKKEGTRELPSALVRAVVALWGLAVSKFPAILDRYSRFSDAHVFDFSFFLS